MATLVKTPYPIYADVDGNPLEDGYIFIGENGLDPVANPIDVYWDEALTVLATAIRTKGGMPSNAGVPGRLYIDEDDYSLVVNDKRSDNVFTNLYAGQPTPTPAPSTSSEKVVSAILAGEGMSLGDPYYVHTDGKAYIAENDNTEAQALVKGICPETVVTDQEFDGVFFGLLTWTAHGYTVGSDYYLGNSTDGTYLIYSGLATEDKRIACFTPLDADTIFIKISYLENLTAKDITVTDSASYTITENTNGNVVTLDSSITTQKTITLSKGSLASISNRVKIYNKSAYTGYHLVTDGTTTWWLEAGKTVEYFFDGSDLMRGQGWELIFDDDSNLIHNLPYADLKGGAVLTADHKARLFATTTTYSGFYSAGTVSSGDSYWAPFLNDSEPYFDISLSQLNSSVSTYNWTQIWRWYE